MAEVYIRADSSTGVVTFIHRRPFDPVKWKESTKRYENMSAQWWIDLYTFLLEGVYGEDKCK